MKNARTTSLLASAVATTASLARRAGLAGWTSLHDFVAKTQVVVKRGNRNRNARFVQTSSDDPVAAS